MYNSLFNLVVCYEYLSINSNKHASVPYITVHTGELVAVLVVYYSIVII